MVELLHAHLRISTTPRGVKSKLAKPAAAESQPSHCLQASCSCSVSGLDFLTLCLTLAGWFRLKWRVLFKTNETPQEIIKRNSGINWTKSFALDSVLTFVGGTGQFSFSAWQSRFLQPVQNSVYIQGQQLLHSKYFCHVLGLLKPFV